MLRRIRPCWRVSFCSSTTAPIGSGYPRSTRFTFGRGETIHTGRSLTGTRRSRVKGSEVFGAGQLGVENYAIGRMDYAEANQPLVTDNRTPKVRPSESPGPS